MNVVHVERSNRLLLATLNRPQQLNAFNGELFDALLAHARAKAELLAALPPASLAATKRLMLAPLREQLLKSIDAENAALARLVGGPANREALRAFAEKRPADFSAL